MCIALVGLPVLAQSRGRRDGSCAGPTRAAPGRAHVNGPLTGAAVAWTYLANERRARDQHGADRQPRPRVLRHPGARSASTANPRPSGIGSTALSMRWIGPPARRRWGPAAPRRDTVRLRLRRPRNQRIRTAVPGKGLHLSFYNGTFEGSGADGSCKNGRRLRRPRGRSASTRWMPRRATDRVGVSQTLDPARPDDPEGGGQIVGRAARDAGRDTIVFATYGAPAAYRIRRRWFAPRPTRCTASKAMARCAGGNPAKGTLPESLRRPAGPLALRRPPLRDHPAHRHAEASGASARDGQRDWERCSGR